MTQTTSAIATEADAHKPANVEVAIDQKAKKAGEKLLKTQRENEIYNNFATPLTGTFLNLPKEPCLIKCPSCGVQEKSEVISDLKWWAIEINNIVGCLFV